MLNINIEVQEAEGTVGGKGEKEKRKHSLKCYLLEKLVIWINCRLEAERDEFLDRARHQRLNEQHDNYRNGYRPHRINFFGLGAIELKVPRDRKGEFQSAWLPERKGQDPELEAFLAEAFWGDCRHAIGRAFRRSTWGSATIPNKSRGSWPEPPANWKPGGNARCRISGTSF